MPHPGKILCVGRNYRNHILEMGRELPRYPTLSGKYAEALVGPGDDIQLPPESSAVDWEAELTLVIGATVRRASAARAEAAIAGFSVLNDGTTPGARLTTQIEGLGRLDNTAVAEVVA